MQTSDYIALEEQLGAHNYKPLDVVLTKGEGVWVWDVDGNRYLDCLSAYSALRSTKPVVSVTAVRTGSGKSQTSRRVVSLLKTQGKRVVTVRHPMPYGDLIRQVVQRFAAYEDFDRHHCTIEEREEYEPVVAMGSVVYAGVDYEKILRRAEKEADVIVWDGGNNDTPFFKPDVNTDPSKRPLKNTHTWATSCPPWVTAKPRLRIWKRPSTPPPVMWCWRRRPSI